jgi:hypothetical protein
MIIIVQLLLCTLLDLVPGLPSSNGKSIAAEKTAADLEQSRGRSASAVPGGGN